MVAHACHSIFLNKFFSLWPMLAIQFFKKNFSVCGPCLPFNLKKKIFRLWPMLAIQFFKKNFQSFLFPRKKEFGIFFPNINNFLLEY